MAYTPLTESMPKARKVHICDTCGLEIKKGEIHHRFDGIYDGEFHTSREHIKCHEITKNWEEWEFEDNDPSEFRELYLEVAK
ncbi:MAG: hypothetical protein HRT63_12735 [Erythrobacter sp.]|nr:hypothetical protein [Erythrobacter sp.]